MDRASFLRNMCGQSTLGLEIGPGYNPIFPKRLGYAIETVDYIDADGLRAKYANAGVDLGAIEDVDYVTHGASLLEVIRRRAIYDFILASHVIEHVPDVISFVNDCAELLSPEGRLVLAIPDKRYCFDALRPPSTAGHMLEAYAEKRTRPPLQAIFDDFFYAATRGGNIGWLRADAAPLGFFRSRPISDFLALMQGKDGLYVNTYVDVHVWQFTPSTFRLAIYDLSSSGYLRLSEADFKDEHLGEFYCSLGRPQRTLQMDRLDLAKQALAELARFV